MRQLFTSLFLITILFICCKSDFRGATIKVQADDWEGDLIYLEDIASLPKTIIDTATVLNGEVSFQTYIEKAGVYRIRNNESNSIVFLYLESGKSDIHIEWLEDKQYVIEGNLPSKQLHSLIQRVDQLDNEKELLQDKIVTDSLSLEQVEREEKRLENRWTGFLKNWIDTVQNEDVAAFALNYLYFDSQHILYLVDVSEKLHKSNPHAAYAELWHLAMSNYKEHTLGLNENGLKLGTIAPPLELLNTQRELFTLDSLKGKYVLLNFWASWCIPCREEIPHLARAYEEFNDRELAVVSVSLDVSRKSWVESIQQDDLEDWIHLSDLLKWKSPVVSDYSIHAIPSNFLIAPSGKVLAKDLRGKKLHSVLNQYLPPKPDLDSSLIRVDSLVINN